MDFGDQLQFFCKQDHCCTSAKRSGSKCLYFSLLSSNCIDWENPLENYTHYGLNELFVLLNTKNIFLCGQKRLLQILSSLSFFANINTLFRKKSSIV